MDDNPKQQLKGKIKLEHCQKTVSGLLEENESLLHIQKRAKTGITSDIDHPEEEAPLLENATKHLNDIEFAHGSIQPQIKLTLEKYNNSQSTLSTSKNRSVIQSADNQMQVAKVSINQQVGQSEDMNAQNEAKQNPTDQVFVNGTLPEEVYLYLMSVTGVQDCLLSNRLVCPLWNGLVLERCRNQQSLKLFESFHILMEYGEMLLKYEKTDDASLILKSVGDDLLFEKPGISHEQLIDMLRHAGENGENNREASKVLTTFFPKVTQLVLCTENFNSLIDIEHFLNFYAKQLTSLTMTNFESRTDHPGRKLRAFNLPMLKSLHTFYFSQEDDQLLPLLPQLKSLTLHTSSISLESLLRAGTQLEELNMYNLESVYTAPVDEFSKCLPIKTNLRQFSFEITRNLLQALEFISLYLTSLKGLKLCFDCDRDNVRHLHSVTSYLVPLHKLHSLTFQAPVSFFLLDDNQLAEILPLPSVRHLTLLLSGYASLSMDLFSRAIFTAFPKVEQIRIAFVGDNFHSDNVLVDTSTFAAFEDFAGKHPNVVQLFRSKGMSRFTSLPNAVSPLLGHRRQMYEEYIEEEELFGVPICKLAESLVTQHGEDRPDLKITLRAADRLTAMSNLFKILESNEFAFTFDMANTMLMHMIACALKCGPFEGELFKVTCQCVLNLLACNVLKDFTSDEPISFLELACEFNYVYNFLLKMEDLVEHYQKQQFVDLNILFQIVKRAVLLLEHYSLHDKEDEDDYEDEEEVEDEDTENENTQFNLQYSFKILMKLADLYKTEELNLYEEYGEEDLLLQIRDLMDVRLEKFDNEHLVKVINEFLCGENLVYRVEMALLLLGRHDE